MHKGTEVLRTKEVSLRDEKRTAEHRDALDAARHKQEEAVAERRLRRRKRRAVDKVDEAAALAVLRLDANNGAGWKEKGFLLKVCKRSGPHHKAFCIFHSEEIAVVSIPDTMKEEYYDVTKSRTAKVQVVFKLGADGHVYRNGLDKVYRAELMKRDWPEEIRAIARKIDRIYS